MHARREVERRFPVRVRIAVPLAGLGRQLEVMRAWLDATCGTEGWAMAPAGMAGIINDALALYFEDPAFAHAFVARFCCGYRVATIDDALTIRRGARPDRRTATIRETPR
jgi:hypothetical protein